MHDVMLESRAARDLDIIKGHPYPFAGVDVPVPVHRPPHVRPSVSAIFMSVSRPPSSSTARVLGPARCRASRCGWHNEWPKRDRQVLYRFWAAVKTSTMAVWTVASAATVRAGIVVILRKRGGKKRPPNKEGPGGG